MPPSAERGDAALVALLAERFQHAPVALVITDPAGIIKEASEEAIALLGSGGRTRQIGRAFVLHVARSARIEFNRMLGRLAGGDAHLEARIMLQNPRGKPFPARLRASALPGGEIMWQLEDISEQERAEKRLRAALERERHVAEQLNELDAIRNAFVLAVSHDLRAPIAAISGLAEVLLSRHDRLDSAEAQKALRQIWSSSRELISMVTDLLDIQRLRRGSLSAERVAVRLPEVVADVLAGLDAGGRQVVEQVEDVTAAGDPSLVRRIVANLVKNAVAHTPPESTIWVRARAEPDGVLVIVEDDGGGIPADEKPRVFELFYRGRSVGQPSGLGVGLALVRQFAELQGGHARAEDRPGGGASFHVLLPAWTGPVATAPRAEDQEPGARAG